MMTFVFDRVENIVGKEENAGYQHFLLSLQCFQKAVSLKVGIVLKRVKPLPLIAGAGFIYKPLLSLPHGAYLHSCKWTGSRISRFLY